MSDTMQLVQYELLTYEQKIQIALKLTSPGKFYLTYFNYLPLFPTQKSCFEYLNDIFMDVYGYERYSSYNSFYVYMHRQKKK